jgi:hydrogenase-4 membrane subunit HyfE
MSNNRPEPNAELAAGVEPLRVVFAIGALLLGFFVVFLQA